MKNLKKIREKKRMSLEELAAKSGVKYPTLYSYENQGKESGVVKARAIAKALDVTIEELTG